VRCLGDTFDPREALIPSRRDARHLSLGLSQTFVADGVACLAAGAMCLYEAGTLKDEKVLGDALSCDGELASQRTRRRFVALEQEVEQLEPHRIAERRPQAVGILGVLRHRLWSEPVTRAA
jgi:hypothetical protein